ncbi:FH1/FH2 domain-containing protein 3 [Lucilia cuprina]|nr:FH1/FH2 domain-containing protein 3 [Lucilia cuprina]
MYYGSQGQNSTKVKMSYRSSYTPWKSSLSPNYKTGASSAYSSRDDVSATSRYSSLASPSSYRPSFSGGTYRLKRDTPIVPTSTYVSRYSAATSSPATKPDTSSTSDSSGSKPGQLKRYGSTASSLGKYSREPSPAALEHTNRIKSRDPSPATRSLRGKSRDPSPALDTKCKIGYGSSASSYRMNVPKSTTGNTYGTRYGSSSTAGRTPAANNSSTSISYLSASDFKARSISKAREAATRKSNEKELEAQKTEEKEENKPEATSNEESTGSSETDEEDDEEEEDNEEKFVSVAVCTRATSPTPPGTAPIVHRTRRIEIAKTIEKTIQRSTRKKKMLEKEIQSDRLDDSTRYSRFGLSSRVSSPYSPHTERYTSSSLRYSHSPLSTTASKSSSLNSTSESKKDDVSASSTSASSKANKSPLNSKSKLSPPKSIKITSRQSSMENLSAHKPPAAPKGESPTKSTSSSTGVSTKLPNKDFRKSALNVGPTDRPRKSRTPSTGTDSDLNTVEALNGALQAIQRLERSPSAGSEVSNASNRSIRRTGTDSKLRPRCHNKSFVNGSVVSPKSPLSRNNSTSNIKAKSSTSTSSTTTQSSAGTTTTTSSSSGTESCTESKKCTKKIIKKKAIKDVTNTSSSTSTTATSTSPTTHSTADSRSIKSSSENSFSQQPPAASVNNQKAKKSDSSATNSRTTPKTPSDKDPLRRLKKLSSVSNFFAAQQQDNANNDEQIYLESSENSSSGNDLDRSLSKKSISLTQANETKTTPSPAVKTKTSGSSSKSNPNYTINSIDEPKNNIKTTKSTSSTSSTKTKTKTKSKSNTKSSSTSTSYCPQETTTVNESSIMPSELQTESLSPYTTTNPTTSSTSGTDQEESSWWQDTSRQIDTASALDFNLKDEMRFKIRHIDSGETAWWLRNDEDDTLADDDLKTLNQEEELEEDEDDEEEATDHIQSLTSTPSGNAAKLNDKPGGWWITNETNDETPNEDEEKHETIYVKSRSSNDLDYPSNGYCVEEAPVEAKPFPKSRITPETDWWNDDNEEAQAEYTVNNNPSLNSDKTSNKSGNNLSQLSDKLPKQNGSIQLKICRVESGEKPWWLQEEQQTETQPQENEITVEATIALPKKNKDKTDSSSSNSDSKNRWMSGPTKKVFNIPRVESGEKAWWQEETSESKSDKASENKNYKRNNSQEQEWWLEESSQQQKPPTTPQHNYQQNGYFEPPAPIQQQQQQYYHNTEEEAELQQYQHSSYNHNNLIDSQAELSNSFNFEYSERPPPLGQCASPVQQEELLPPPPPQQRQQCTSPYDNIPMTKVQTAASQQPILETSTNYMASGGGGGPIYQQDIVYLNQSPLQQQPQQQYFPHQRQQQHQQNPNYLQQPPTPYNQYNNNELRSRNGQLFISRHQNIDELLGGSCRPISPLYYDNNGFQTMPPQLQPQQTPTPSQQRNMFVEEITPDQVRIHDSTAQMPIIQRMERDDWQRDSLAAKPTTPPRFEQRMIDDAAIQVYKDGDYGSYLDLESSLAEQSEEIEGLNSSRKNSLVVRTQLSVRVHAIIEKLLSAEGSDLRRALFSLKQVFQEDKDLVHAFVALGGLNCLVRVGNGADQNYQNYILNNIVMLYVDGMNGVMKHEPTMQWLYSLIASNYRSVVKTALKLLLVFVEYAESNCHVLVSAIHAVDKQQGTLPWSNIMRLLKDYDNADAELVIYAASLINKTLEGLNDQDSFYDESDLLEQQGMESVIQHYMSKPGTDMDLLNQLQLYEAVLKFEDGESDGTRLPDNTLRKTQRFRSSTDTAERRKSRRHSTGTSPGNINKVLPTHMRLTPTQPALDEDSSSSTNSAEFSGGVFAEKKPRDGAGVTPGLRRRRERAERHRSFLKEQQEAAAAVAANGYMNSTDNREDMGQLVTAIPVTLKNGDSPPESLNIINENNCNYNNNNNHITNTNNHNNNNNLKHSYQNNNNTINHSNVNANLNVIVNATANANATNNNNALITNNHNNNNHIITNSNTATHNNNNNHINLLSPTKQLLGTNTISIINNSFDKSNTNKLQHHQHHLNHNVNAPAATSPAAEFYNKKNLFMERNATVINGLMKNIQRHNVTAETNNLEGVGAVNGTNLHANHCDNVVNYKKFENDANRLNTYYNQINNSTPKNQQHQQSIQSPNSTTTSPVKHNLSSLNSSPKKTINSTTTSTAMTNPPLASGFDYIPQTSTPHTTPVKYAATTTTMEDNTTTTYGTPSTPRQRVMSPNVSSYPVQNAYNNTITTTTSVAPPPPPPPPPPPDLWGNANNMRMPPPPPPPPPPPYFYHQHSNNMSYNQNTTTNNIIPNSNQANNAVNTTNNNLNSNSDQPVDLLQINESDNEDKKLLLQLKRDHTVKDLTQKLCNLPTSPTTQDDKLQNRIVGDMSGLISKAKEGLAKSKSKGEMSSSKLN